MPAETEKPALRVAVVGVGHLGKEHARVYDQLDGVDLVAVADVDEKQGKRVARKHRAKWSNDYKRLLDKVDAVSVVVPTVLHHEVARFFLEAGKHVLVEKPMTRTLGEAQELVDLARANGAVLQVGHIERFNPVMRAINKFDITPVFLECHRLAPYTFRSSDVGVVLDLMIHDIDIIQSLVKSPIDRIEAVGVPVVARDREDIANARLTFESGCVANVTASRVSIKKMRKIRVFAPDCYISLDYLERKGVIYKKSPEMDKVIEKMRGRSVSVTDIRNYDYKDLLTIEHMKIDAYEPLAAELESFVDSVQRGSSPLVTGEEGLRAIATAEQILDQIRLHLEKAGAPISIAR